MDGAQPAMQFLKECRVFNPTRAILFSEKEDLSNIPGFQDVLKEEINVYFSKFTPAAVRASELLTQICSGTACKSHY